MSRSHIHPLTMSLFTILVSLLPSVRAEPPMRQRAVDVFSLRDGTRLLGVSLSPPDEDSPTVLISGAWLSTQFPDLYKQVAKSPDGNAAPTDQLQRRLTQHIDQLRATEPKDIERIGFLTERLTDVKARPKSDDTFDLIVMKIPSSLIRRQFLQKPSNRKLGGLALLNAIPNMETQSVTAITDALREAATKSALRMTMPESSVDSTDDQFQRILVTTERTLGETCRLISHGGKYLSADGDAVNFQEILPLLLEGHLQSQLGGLLNQLSNKSQPQSVAADNDKLPAEAAAMAKERRVVEISQMELDAVGGTATVHLALYFRIAKSKEFRRISKAMGKAGQADVTAEKMQHIKNDPRVKEVTQLFKVLGTSANSFDKAIAVGAAVEIAQNRARQQLAQGFSLNPKSTTELKILNTTLTSEDAVGRIK